MPTEKQLLNTIFDDATSDNERATAVAGLKKLLGKDRSDLVAKYTSAGSSASALPDDDEPFDFDACPAEYGLDRARVNADFTNPPTVAQLKSMLERTMEEPDAQALEEHAAAIRVLERRVISNTLASRMGVPGARATCAAEIIEIGYRLTECKRIIAGRDWSLWLNHCNCLAKCARDDMLLYEWFARCINDEIVGKSTAVFNLNVDIYYLYNFADPSTPEAARAEVLRRTGEKLDDRVVEAIIRTAKAKERKGPKGAQAKGRSGVNGKAADRDIGGPSAAACLGSASHPPR
jgi:hypothetical protein